jgi:hypothetical protein
MFKWLALLCVLITVPAMVAQNPGRLPTVTGPGRMPPVRPGDIEPYCQAFATWSQTLSNEFPNDGLRTGAAHLDRPTLYRTFASLLRDESFVPVFGRRYDQLTPQDLEGIQPSVVRPCLARHIGMWGYTVSLQEMFASCAGYAACVQNADFRGLVISGRAMREQVPDMLKRVRAFTQQNNGYNSLINYSTMVTQNLTYLLPTERKELESVYAESRRSTADHLLDARLRPLLQSGTPDTLRNAAVDYAGPLKDASPDIRAKYQELIAASVAAPSRLPSGDSTPPPAPGAFEFRFPASLGPDGLLTGYRSTEFNGAFQSEFRDAAEQAFPEIFATYKAAGRHVFVYGGDVDLGQFNTDLQLAPEQRILACGYANKEVNRVYFFWHSTVVGAARPPRLKAIEPLHPFLMIGRPMESCPADAHAAMTIIRDNFRTGADYARGKLPSPDLIPLPPNLTELKRDWDGINSGVRSCERFASGRSDGLPYPRHPDLSALTDQQRQTLTDKAHNFATIYWGQLAYRDPNAYLSQLSEYNRTLLEMMK